MRVFISADIEGITTTTLWEECRKGEQGYDRSAQQMTSEVKAACEGAIEAGATYILVKDAHASGTNIDISQLPDCVELVRAGCGSPMSMAYGVDSSFDAAMFIGYHAAAGREGNPLSHTYTTSTVYIKLNGVKCSEFMLYSYAAAAVGVPTVFLSGDKMLCDDSAQMHPLLKSVAVKDGYGGMTKSIHPSLALKRIRETACSALKQDLSTGKINLPSHFELEVRYKEQTMATRHSFYSGCRKIDDNTIVLESDSLFEILRAVQYIL